VLIVGATGAALIAMLKAFVTLPPAFVAFTVKLDVATAVGVPEISPVPPFKLKPTGRLPLSIDQVIGAVPPAESVTL